MSTPHWAETIDPDELHEPTVRAVVDTMRRSGAAFGAAVLESQLQHGQVVVASKEAARLRELAKFIETHPDAAVPTLAGASRHSPVYLFCNDQDDMLVKRRALGGGPWEKSVDDAWFMLTGQIGSTWVQLNASRNAVCERVVVGTETKLVPNPDAPKIATQVEIVEWRCPDALLEGTVPEPETTTADDDIPF